MTTNQLAPQNRDAEEAILGSVFINPECFYEVSRVLKPSDFYIHRNGYIWQAFENLVNNQKNIDLLTVTDELDTSNYLAEIGGAAYLTKLVGSSPMSLNCMDYAVIIKKASERRIGIAFANKLVNHAYDESNDFSLGEEALRMVKESHTYSSRLTPADASNKMNALVDNTRCFTTGVKDVDEKVGGLFPEEFSVLAGYPGCGKSAIKSQGARRNAENGKRVLLIDLEMTASQTWFRMACGDLEIDVNAIRSGKVDESTKDAIKAYSRELASKYQKNMVIYQAPMTPTDILGAAMMEQPDIVYVDTMKNLAGKQNNQSTQQWYDEVCNFLRINVAQRVGCHVQALHHVNRSSKNENRSLGIQDLMYAGESDADNVFLLDRKEKQEGDNTNKNIAQVDFIVGKSRFGWTGTVELNFNLPKQQFFGMSKKV